MSGGQSAGRSAPLIAVLGGTFDPPHVGHLRAAQAALNGTEAEQIWWLPAAIAPHKVQSAQASGEQRVQMVNLLIADEAAMSVCDLELARGGTSYTIDTVTQLLTQYPDKRFAWVVGADMVQFLVHWVEIERLSKMITFIGLARPGFDLDVRALPGFLQERIEIVPMDESEVSSTDIRAALRAGRSSDAWLPAEVRRYIEENGLYED
jgi:nicotinate-nucleotide adenylyltransferase